jgi:hypothetical protein
MRFSTASVDPPRSVATPRMAAYGAKAPSDKKQRRIGAPLDPAESCAAQNDGPGSAAIVYPLG